MAMYLSFVEKLNKLNNGELTDLASIKSIHAEITEPERMATNVHLVVTYQQCLLYLNARKFVTENEDIKEWFTREFNVAYVTFTDR